MHAIFRPRLRLARLLDLATMYCVICLLSSTSAFAAISISATVDKTDLSLEDTLELSVRINGTQNAPSPRLPSLPDFKVEGRGTSSSFQMINGTVNSSVTHRYLLTPKSAGDFVIGAVTLEMDGKTYVAPEITVHVSKENSGIPKPGAPIFAEAAVSKKNPFANEQVILTYRLYRNGEVRNFQLDAPQGNLRRQPLDEPDEYSKVLNGVRYQVYEARFLVSSLKPGKVIIPSALMSMDLVKRSQRNSSRDPFRDFFDNPLFGNHATFERKNLRTQDIELDVQPLPKKNQPESFSNLVGHFTLKGSLSKNQITEGETATYHLSLEGWGNLGDAKITFPESEQTFRVYPDQPQLNPKIFDGKSGGEKRFTFAIVPNNSGKHVIPEFKISFFNPESKRYHTVRAPSATLHVLPGNKIQAGKNTTTSGHSDADALPQSGLLPIHTGEALYETSEDTGQQILITTGVLILSPIAVGIFLMFYNQRARLKVDTAFARRKQARQKAETRLSALSENQMGDHRSFAREVSLILREYVGDKLNLQGTAYTAEEMQSLLNNSEIQKGITQSLFELLEKCESMQYATAGASEDFHAIEETKKLIQHLEDQL